MSVYLMGIRRFEYKVLVRLNSIIEHRVLRGLVLAVTQLGEMITPFILAGIFLVNTATRPVAFLLAAAHFATFIPVQLIKEAVARPRPYQAYRNITNGGPSLKDYSFPRAIRLRPLPRQPCWLIFCGGSTSLYLGGTGWFNPDDLGCPLSHRRLHR